MSGAEPRLYRELAPWFHLLTAPSDYAEEADMYRALLLETAERPVRTVLELGSGGGNNASHLKEHFELTLVDRSPEMLELSRSLNPECRHLEGDMRDARVGERFDAVFVHDAVCYLLSEEELRAMALTAFEHCLPDGAVVVAPDYVREHFAPGSRCGGHDGQRQALRYLEWTWDPDPDDSTYLTDYAYLLRDERGDVRVEQDRHVLGLFEIGTWLEVLKGAGFVAESRMLTFSDGDDVGTVVFAGRKPGLTMSAR